MLLRVSAAWCTVLAVLLLATAGGFWAVRSLYAGVYATRDAGRTVPWMVVGSYPRNLPNGAGCGIVPLAGSMRVEQTFQPDVDQHIAGIEVHALPSAHADRPRVCRWALMDSSGDPPKLLREGTSELVPGYGFLKIWFAPLTIRAGGDYEVVLHGPGDAPERMIVPLFEMSRPWGILRLRESSTSEPVERTDKCVQLRLLDVPPQD